MESQGLFLGGVRSALSSEGQVRANLMNKVQGRETRGNEEVFQEDIIPSRTEA